MIVEDNIPIVSAEDPIAASRRKATEQHNADVRIRERAAQLQGGSHNRWPKPVKIRMRSGQVIEVGGEALVMALANGGQPVTE